MIIYVAVLLSTLMTCVAGQAPLAGFRPPAVPLVTIDPYLNIWSVNDDVTDGYSVYWTLEDPKEFRAILRVDGVSSRLLGSSSSMPSAAAKQISVKVWPTRTSYLFEDEQSTVQVTVEFTTPLLPQQWEVSSRPVTYVTFTVTSLDHRQHDVQLLFEVLDQLVVKSVDEQITWSTFKLITDGGVRANVMAVGKVNQSCCDTVKDNSYIDWGYAHLAVPTDVIGAVATSISYTATAIGDFTASGQLPPDDTDKPRAADDDFVALNAAWNFTVSAIVTQTVHAIFAYDDIYAVNYFDRLLRPYWRSSAADDRFTTLLNAAIDDYATLTADCEQFDTELVQNLTEKGGTRYATLASLAYRQTVAATKLVWNEQLDTAWAFLKSISTDLDMSAVDAIAAAAPLFLYVDPDYLQLLLMPILAYANNDLSPTHIYPYQWAPRSLGTYPRADIVPTLSEALPMEESGNMLIMLAAITNQLGNTSTSDWYPQYWKLLQTWAEHLTSTLPSPGVQNCTDNYDTYTVNNANLAIKGIVGLGAFAQLCDWVGENCSSSYLDLAESLVTQWVTLAKDGDHYRLAYNSGSSWSLKYNLFYDQLLGLDLFPYDVITDELAYYMNHMNLYGIPLDSRATYTKLDAQALVAAMTNDTAQQEDIFDAMFTWAETTDARTPLTDCYDTISGKQTAFTARPVVGALFGLMLV